MEQQRFCVRTHGSSTEGDCDLARYAHRRLDLTSRIYTDVDDVVSGIVLATESKKASKQTYILAGDSMTYKELISVINTQCGRIEPLLTLPFSLTKPALASLAPVLRRRTRRELFADLSPKNVS
jgi:nucleoside-diphosphate-sugar epimerase